MPVFQGNDDANVLTGTAEDDTLNGYRGNDTLDGREGADFMDGGDGDDLFIVDNAADVAKESEDGGGDTVRSSVSFSLAGWHVEYLALTGTAAINGTGNDRFNQIDGNAASNILTGGGGGDRLNGHAGDDTMDGGYGDDSFWVDSSGDRVVERHHDYAGGIDIVTSSVSFSLVGQYIERLTLTGTASTGTGNSLSNVITGNASSNTLRGAEGNDTLVGAEGADFLYGDSGSDRLDGGAGIDTLRGGVGSDIYIVDDAGDSVSEPFDGGRDVIYSSATYSLAGIYVENIALTGSDSVDATGNSLANRMMGNDAANVLSGGEGDDALAGNGGNDSLSGGGGADDIMGGEGNDRIDGGADGDTMTGGRGNDTYFIDSASDVIREYSDSVQYGTDTVHSTLSYALSIGLENLILSGSAAIDGTGTKFNNTIYGNSAANVLDAGAGDDRIFGGFGNDTLSGGAGSDRFYFQAALDPVGNVDVVTDFQFEGEALRDMLMLSDSIFTELETGALAESAFHRGTSAHDADDRIIYDSATGNVFYDADGTGSAAQILFVNVGEGDLTHLNFSIY